MTLLIGIVIGTFCGIIIAGLLSANKMKMLECENAGLVELLMKTEAHLKQRPRKRIVPQDLSEDVVEYYSDLVAEMRGVPGYDDNGNPIKTTLR